MADPLSLAASVAGLVSLGIQVTTGISKYLDALNSREEELRTASQQNKALRNTVAIIENAVKKLEQVSPDASSTAKEHVRGCRESLDNLETFVAELAGSDVDTWRSRLKTGKFHYVFDRPKVLQLSARVSKTNSDLQLAVVGLGLSIDTDIHQSVRNIQSEVPVLQSGITLVQNQLHAHHQASTQRMVDHVREQQLTTRLQNEYLERNQEHNETLDDRMATVERSTHVMEAMLSLVLLNGASDGLPDDGTRSARTVARFATKPAAFKELCETVSSHSELEATAHDVVDTRSTWNNAGQSAPRQDSSLAWNTKSPASCICGRTLQTKTNLEYSQLGSLYLYRKVESRRHSPYCPRSKSLVPKQKRRYGLRYTGLMQAIKGAIDITFNTTSGAGGWSVSPGFRYYPTVDATQDPAFRILHILENVLDLNEPGIGVVPIELYNVFYSGAMKKLRWLFDNGKTSPLAVDAHNRSLMHEAFIVFRTWIRSRYVPGLTEFVRMLLDNGVPPISYDTRGYTAGFDHYGLTPGWSETDEAVMIIAEADSGAMPMSINKLKLTQARPMPLELTAHLEKSVPLAEAWGCGPLSIAVLQGDKRGAKSLLERCPMAVAEKNLFGCTPLHLAVFSNTLPSFPFILEVANIADLLREVDEFGHSILILALDITRQSCCNSIEFLECTDCSCSDSLAMLLGIGAVLNLDDLKRLSYQSASARAWRVFFSHLKGQREQLRQIALRHQWAIRKCLGLMQETSVLDLHASTIRKVLLDNGIEVPVDLVLTADDAMHVYNFIPKNAQLAEMLFKMGFRDIDFDIQYGEPPLTKSPEPDYIYWLIERGADLKRRIRSVTNDQYKTSGIFSAHFAMFNLGHKMKKGHTQTMVSTIARILPISLTDHCFCQCSTDGCTPFIYMLKAYYGDASEPCGIADMDFINMSNGLPIGIIKSLYLSVARFACFEYLDLTHTCCDASRIVCHGQSYVVKDSDEVEEIQQEESALLSLLDEMVGELAGRIDDIIGDPAQLQACWVDYWEDYAFAVLDELNENKMTEEERRSAKMIGVVWESETDDESASDDEPEVDIEAEIDRLFRELNSIGEDDSDWINPDQQQYRKRQVCENAIALWRYLEMSGVR